MQIVTAKRLRDALDAAAEIHAIASGNASLTDKQMRVSQLAIERLLVTVGEALNHAIQSDRAIEDAIPDARLIIGLRNRVVHGYDTIRADIIWDTAHHHIPNLADRLRELLDDAPAPDARTP